MCNIACLKAFDRADLLGLLITLFAIQNWPVALLKAQSEQNNNTIIQLDNDRQQCNVSTKG